MCASCYSESKDVAPFMHALIVCAVQLLGGRMG